MRWNEIARLESPNKKYMCFVLTAEEIADHELPLDMFFKITDTLYVSRVPGDGIETADLIDWFFPGMTYDFARPDWWNRQHTGTPEYNQVIWIYPPGSASGQPFNFVRELFPKFIEAAVETHRAFHAPKEDNSNASS
jgi:hypothetical protein